MTHTYTHTTHTHSTHTQNTHTQNTHTDRERERERERKREREKERGREGGRERRYYRKDERWPVCTHSVTSETLPQFALKELNGMTRSFILTHSDRCVRTPRVAVISVTLITQQPCKFIAKL